ncbi:carboxymuconolactone decarboxylase family protein [Catenuloplanes indicus]|uniref:Alkylhydroperoxidase family enzyme n=1 Tax=Catenuloplanes indicus TaxID=137267 RepID=A0AAE3VVJ9_9ACTN|nr:carboxymuconolactone decarboxylase family protein [Catenuloplanes indicus]MDQ0364407.1 alkylhydroperoxidase family enzyme [Catenuloplanes indicus]
MIANRVASSVVQRQVKYVTPVPADTRTGPVGRVYAQVADEMGIVVPPAALHSPSPDVLAAFWTLMRETLIADGSTGRALRETVAAAVSMATICPYCADMHTVGLYDLIGEEHAETVARDRPDQLTDPRLRELAVWARTAHEPGAAQALPGWLDRPGRAEVIGVAVTFHYLSRMVNVFLSNFLLPPRLGANARRRLKRGLSVVLRPTLREGRRPGRALPLLPAAGVPADGWALGSPYVAEAVARSSRVLEAAGARALSPAVRGLVRDRLHDWHGEETGLSTRWCEDLTAGLPAPDRAAARLVLLTALASYQVDADVIAEFRAHHAGDAALVDAAAWGAYAAARLIGARNLSDVREGQ